MRLPELSEVIELERKCCPFLRFVLTVEPAGGPLRLELSGAAGTKEFLASLLPVAAVQATSCADCSPS